LEEKIGMLLKLHKRNGNSKPPNTPLRSLVGIMLSVKKHRYL